MELNKFNIEFNFDNQNFTANVTKIGNGPIQYHITDVKPNSALFPECIIMSWNYNEEKLEWGVSENYNPLFNYIMAGAIFKNLIELKITTS
jgi:hypothetical protein